MVAQNAATLRREPHASDPGGSRSTSRTPWASCLLWGLMCCLVFSSIAWGQRRARTPENPFPQRVPAASLDGGVSWLNSSGPISLRDLRGKIVLLDFWTYCCINCLHILPDLKYLEEKYADQLVVIGVHVHKFTNEGETENIRQAILRYNIEHPVVNDSNRIIARRYNFDVWPSLALIDPEGNLVGAREGEGTRDLFDQAITRLIRYHRAKGTLDETPIRFDLEREQEPPRPLKFPGKVLADPENDRVFIADTNNNRVVISSLSGELIDVVGNGRIGRQDGGFKEATFDHPQGMALANNVLYLADTENHMIRAIDLEAKQVTTLAGIGRQARFGETNGGPLRRTPLNSPWALQELNGNLFIAMAGPHQVWRHAIGSDVIRNYAGSSHEDILDGPLARAALAQPSGITTDGRNLYIVDSEGSAVRRIGIGPNALVTTVVGPHDMPNGQALFAYGDQDGIGAAVRLQHPLGIVYRQGGLFVADTYNHKIKYVDLQTRRCVTWLGTGQRGEGLDPVQMYEPGGLSITDTHLFIADTNNHRILQTDLQTKETRVFTVAALKPPEPSEIDSQEETFAGRTEKLPRTTIGRDAPLQVKLNFELPAGQKLNQRAAVVYRISSNGEQNLVPDDELETRRRADAEELSASLTVPLTGNTGEHTFQLTVTYQYCNEGTSGLCRFAAQRWEIPLTVADSGPSELTLTATPGTE
jgi:thiol-disulfide isomerase/thioredoxin